MNQPVIFDKKPQVVTLTPGKYYWCSCGQSKNQPFCDGGHKGTDFVPQAFEITEEKKVAICLCKHSQNPPFCDGAHTQL